MFKNRQIGNGCNSIIVAEADRILLMPILNIFGCFELYKACLHRIFKIPLKLLYISSGNPKTYSLDLEFSKKIKNRRRIIESDAGLKISPFLCGLFR